MSQAGHRGGLWAENERLLAENSRLRQQLEAARRAGKIEGTAVEITDDHQPLALTTSRPLPALPALAPTSSGSGSGSGSGSDEMLAAGEDRREQLHGEIASLEQRIAALLARNPTHAPNQKLLGHLSNERQHLLTFLKNPGIAATNWRAEQAIRPAVVNRKNWGGNRTDHGADVQQTLMSVIRTARQQDVCPIALLTDLLHHIDPAPSSRLHLPAATTTIDPRGP